MTTYKKRPKSPEKQQKIDAFTAMAKQLAGEIDENRRSTETKAKASQAKALPGLERFSELNQILILTQDPEGEEAYTFNGWRERGKQVRKGAKCIYIRAPRTGKNDKGDTVLKGMSILPVFTQNQVDPLEEGAETWWEKSHRKVIQGMIAGEAEEDEQE